MKIANNNNAGPFGGSIAFQVAGAGAAAGNTTTAASTTTAKAATAKAKGNKAAKRFEA